MQIGLESKKLATSLASWIGHASWYVEGNHFLICSPDFPDSTGLSDPISPLLFRLFYFNLLCLCLITTPFHAVLSISNRQIDSEKKWKCTCSLATNYSCILLVDMYIPHQPNQLYIRDQVLTINYELWLIFYIYMEVTHYLKMHNKARNEKSCINFTLYYQIFFGESPMQKW